MLEGVHFLHSNWVLHRDLKSSNILYNSKGELKVGAGRGGPVNMRLVRLCTVCAYALRAHAQTSRGYGTYPWIDTHVHNSTPFAHGSTQICDFGLARQYGSPLKPYTQLVVTLWYRSPELLLGCKVYSTAVDVSRVGWAASCKRICPMHKLDEHCIH